MASTFALGPPPDPKDPRFNQWMALMWSYILSLPTSTAVGATGAAGLDATQPDELLTIMGYAFERIQNLEQILGVYYTPLDIDVPDEYALVQAQDPNLY